MKAHNSPASATAPLRRFAFASAVLLAANIIAGVCNYAFQLLAAKDLSLSDYGQLSAWLAALSLYLSLGSVAQTAGNFFPLTASALRVHAVFALLLLGGIHVFMAQGQSMLGFEWPWLTSFAALLANVSYAWLAGQIQIRLAFSTLALAMTMGGLLRIATVQLAEEPGLDTYQLALPLGFMAAMATAALGLLIAGTAGPKPNRVAKDDAAYPPTSPPNWANMASNMACAIILAVASAAAVQIDILNLGLWHEAATLGLYARSALFAKAIFFAAFAFLQISLPLHLRAQDGDLQLSRLLTVVEIAIFAACLIAAGAAAWLGPMLARATLGIDLEAQRLWIFLSCTAAGALYGILQTIQEACARRRPWPAALRLAAMTLPLALSRLVTWCTVDVYLVAVTIYYLLLNFILRLPQLGKLSRPTAS